MTSVELGVQELIKELEIVMSLDSEGYDLFIKEKRSEAIKELFVYEEPTPKEVMKKLVEMWMVLSGDERTMWNEKAA